MNPIEIANSIISLPKEQRREFRQLVYTSSDLWNAVNGIGNINPNLEKGTIRGLVKKSGDSRLVGEVTVTATKEGFSLPVVSDDNGEYSITLDPGVYNLSFQKSGYQTTVIDNVSVITSNELILNTELRELISSE